jgi:teichuronic acid biosynthesis glycosyltransferase TuaG
MNLEVVPCVDIIIPFYRETEQLHSAVLSCLLPGNNGYIASIVLVCDGLDEIYQWAKDNVVPIDRRIILFKTRGGEGSGVARNAGLLKSKSEFVAFLDADDIWLQNKISKQLRALNLDQEATACCTAYVIDGASLVIPRSSYCARMDVLKYLGIGTSTMLIRRLSLRNLTFTSRRFSQDTEFWVNFVNIGNKIIGMNECSCIYFPSARTSNKFEQLISFYALVGQYDISFLCRVGVIFRYSVRGIINHFISHLIRKI